METENLQENESRNETQKVTKRTSILAGIPILLFTLLCAAGAIVVIVAPPNREPDALTIIFGALLLMGSIWGLIKAIRLIKGNPDGSKRLISPRLVKVSVYLIILMPIVAISMDLFSGEPKFQRFMTVVLTMLCMKMVSYIMEQGKRKP